MSFKNKDGCVIVRNLITTIQDNKEYLSEIDGKIGDGDHGINMNKGFTLCGERLSQKACDMSGAFSILSSTLMADIGGSMGPLYGVFFEALAETSKGKEDIDAALFGSMLRAGLREIQDIGSARRGDKTLLDTLIPGTEAYVAALEKGAGFAEALAALKEAAEEGWRETEGMVAKIGRASRLGERSRGVLDAGATSCYLILSSMADTVQQLISA